MRPPLSWKNSGYAPASQNFPMWTKPLTPCEISHITATLSKEAFLKTLTEITVMALRYSEWHHFL